MRPAINTSAQDVEDKLNGWLHQLGSGVPAFDSLLQQSAAAQLDLGYFHTLREICQQPATWRDTADLAVSCASMLAGALEDVRQIVLTGSGSSLYAAECLALLLQDSLGIPAQSIAAGQLLTHGKQALPPSESSLLISLARSGDSPESDAVVRDALALEPACRHLIITCNPAGRLAINFTHDSRVRTLTLDDRTCDRSLVMTSSFTNMVVAGWALANLHRLPHYRRIVEEVAAAGSNLLLHHAGRLAAIARQSFRSAVYLASGDRLGAANECALKMLESTAGRVDTFSETYLGLRHGRMSAIKDDTLLVCLLSSSPQVRRYELDLLAELNRKRIGATRVILGSSIPAAYVRDADIAIETGELPGDSYASIIDVMAGQLLAFFRCLQEGLEPDSPSRDGIINRVVEEFPVYFDGAGNGA